MSADVLAVSGLDTGRHAMKPGDTLPPPGPNYWVAPPTSTYYGSKIATNEPTANGQHWPWTVAGYTPQQVRGAYNVSNSGMTGRGQTVAIVDAYASPTMLADANEFSRVTGGRGFRPGQYQQYLPSTFSDTAPDECDAQGWYGEETLDVESVHDMAPDANVHFVAGASCSDNDLFAADALIVNQHLASIVSNSFGEPYDDATIQSAWDQVFEYGAIEGIGFMFSSGDSGYEDPAAEDPGSDQIQVDYPTSSPWVTSVGGTSVAIGPRQQLAVGDPVGHAARPAGGERPVVDLHASARVPRRLRRLGRRRRQHRLHGAVVPARRRSIQPRDGRTRRVDHDPDASRAGRLGTRRPEHRNARRSDDPPAERENVRVLAQPDRRHERFEPDVRGHRGRRSAGRRA